MAKKKKAVTEIDESRLVTTPEVAPEGALFVDVAYEHRGHREPHECCGVVFKPGHVITLRSIEDVPEAMREDRLLRVHAATMGACRLQTTFRYTPMSQPAFDVYTAQAEAEAKAAEPEPVVEEVVRNPDKSAEGGE